MLAIVTSKLGLGMTGGRVGVVDVDVIAADDDIDVLIAVAASFAPLPAEFGRLDIVGGSWV